MTTCEGETLARERRRLVRRGAATLAAAVGKAATVALVARWCSKEEDEVACICCDLCCVVFVVGVLRNRKLVVECSGEGVMFVEAEANVALEELGDSIRPPCLHRKHFLHQVHASQGILGCPLLLIQWWCQQEQLHEN